MIIGAALPIGGEHEVGWARFMENGRARTGTDIVQLSLQSFGARDGHGHGAGDEDEEPQQHQQKLSTEQRREQVGRLYLYLASKLFS